MNKGIFKNRDSGATKAIGEATCGDEIQNA